MNGTICLERINGVTQAAFMFRQATNAHEGFTLNLAGHMLIC